jgi:hypothetical protein
MPMAATLRYFVFLITHSANGCIGWLVVQPVRTIHLAGLRWVMSSAAITGYVAGIWAPSMKGCSA